MVWFVEFPTFKYVEDVGALAKEAGLRIVDAKFDNGEGEKGPKLTLKPEYQPAEKPKKVSKQKTSKKKAD